MARRKTTKNEEEDEVNPIDLKETKKETTTAFDFQTAIANMEIAESLKAGFTYYIIVNNITIKSENDLNQTFEKFKTFNAGA